MYAASFAKYVGAPSGADEHPVLVVTVRARARPQGRVLLEGVEERNRIRNLGLDLGLARAGVELDAETLEGSLHRGEHPGNGSPGSAASSFMYSP